MPDIEQLQNYLIGLAEAVSRGVAKTLRRESTGELSRTMRQSLSDVIFKVDEVAEEIITDYLKSSPWRLELLAEGIGESEKTNYGPGEKVEWQLLCDPIDGSRGLMYGKRSAFFLICAAPPQSCSISAAEVAVMSEIALLQ